jgi:hypothetical protein
MHVLFIILNDTDYLHEVLATFADLGVKGATILDSQGMASAIIEGDVSSIPLFGSLNSLLQGSKKYNKTIFTVIHTDELLEKATAEVQKLLEHTKRGNAGFMFTIEAKNIYKLGTKVQK